ncbi:MAG: hypothetical protein KIT84_07715 [Labilithrix sp.]|nr:hypothetical protein [Labilithrix sp.]MCW5810883.1 hypothetical protein [Labilithrix sp.]
MRSVAVLALLALVACEPASVAEAEARRDVAWLEKHEGRESFEAMGRLADHDPHAAARLASRTGNADVYHAAWQAHTRGGAWGGRVLRAGLALPADIPLVVAELPKRDPRVDPFVHDVELAVGAANGPAKTAAAALLASLGSSSQAALLRLVDAPATRDATCTGLGGADASEDSRLVLMKAQPESRLAPACQQALLDHATLDRRVLDWLGDAGEPELVASAASTLECTKLSHLWERVFGSSRESIVPLEPALAASTARCEVTLDPVLSRALLATPRVRASVLRVLDSDAIRPDELTSTCKQLPRLAHGRSIPDDVRTLASTLLSKRCNKV